MSIDGRTLKGRKTGKWEFRTQVTEGRNFNEVPGHTVDLELDGESIRSSVLLIFPLSVFGSIQGSYLRVFRVCYVSECRVTCLTPVYWSGSIYSLPSLNPKIDPCNSQCLY